MILQAQTSKILSGVFQCCKDEYLTLVFANNNFYQFFNQTAQEISHIYNNRLSEIILKHNSPDIYRDILLQLEENHTFSVECVVQTFENVKKWIWISAEIIADEKGDEFVYCIFSDITLQKQEQQEAKIIQDRYLFVLNHTEDIVFEWNYETKEMLQMGGDKYNFAYPKVIKKFPDDIIGSSSNIHPDDLSIFTDNYKKYDNGAREAYAEYRICDKNGIYSWCSTTSVAVFENGKIKKVLGRIANINTQKMQLLEMSRKAMSDPLTELYNRKATQSFVDKYIESTHNLAAIMIIDLDNFKLINDTHGHLVGDSVLNEVATHITKTFRTSDIIGRIGGDEFIVFLTDIKTESDVENVSKSVLEAFDTVFKGTSCVQSVSGSIGIAFYPKDGDTYEKLLDKADKALYHAKNTGKNKYVVYFDALKNENVTRPNITYSRTPNDSQRREDLYQLVLEKAKLNVWEYDIKNRRIIRILNSVTKQTRGNVSYENFPFDLIEKGYIHSDSIQPLLDMYENLFNGEKSVSADICSINPKNGGFEWQHIDYATLYDADGNPDIAIGTSKNITEQKMVQIKYHHELEMRTVLEENIIYTAITNLTQNLVEQYRNVEQSNASQKTCTNYEDLVFIELQHIQNLSDKKRYKQLTRKYLIDTFEQGKTQLWFEYRKENKDGQLKWVSLSISMIRNSQNGDIYLYSALRDIDNKKRQELSLNASAKTDDLTGVYLQNTFTDFVDLEIKKCNKNDMSFALIAFEIFPYHKMLQLEDGKFFNEIFLNLIHLIHYKFSGQIVGRFFDNQIFVFIQNADNQSDITKKVNSICDDLKSFLQIIPKKISAKLSSSVVFSNDLIQDFTSLYAYSKISLETAKKSGSIKCIVYSEPTTDITKNTLLATEQGDTTQIALTCAVALVEASDKSDGIFAVLQQLGQYYDAQTTFVADYILLQTSPDLLYTWTKDQNKVTPLNGRGTFFSDYPHIGHELLNSKEVFYTHIDIDNLKITSPTDYAALQQNGVNSFFAAVIKPDKAVIGYVAIINPTKNCENIQLFLTVFKFLSSEIEKRQLYENHKFLSDHDSLTLLYNRNRYVLYLQKSNADSLISLGVVCVDINGLKHLNTLHGPQYGDFAVKKTAQTLSCVFNAYDCYRFAGDEFLVVCENISQSAFYEHIDTLRSMAEDFDDFGISIGYSWCDVDISLEKLAKLSDEKMMNDKQQYYMRQGSKNKRHNPIETQYLLQDIENGNYIMYLQPKMNAQTENIVGAEALVRYLDSQGNIISPDNFIPKCEKNGTIKYIDLFIAKTVCKTLRSWIDAGKKPFCISINLSRATLIAKNVIDELCDIVDEYNLPRNLLEIEITESFSDLGKEAIAEMGDDIARAGFNLALDDFGAKYSNLSILSATKWDTLKLDKSLVNDIFSNKNTQIIIENLFATCKKLGIQTVAEGVETKEQLEIIKSLACDEIQGYYFNKPLPVKDFVKYYL